MCNLHPFHCCGFLVQQDSGLTALKSLAPPNSPAVKWRKHSQITAGFTELLFIAVKMLMFYDLWSLYQTCKCLFCCPGCNDFHLEVGPSVRRLFKCGSKREDGCQSVSGLAWDWCIELELRRLSSPRSF